MTHLSLRAHYQLKYPKGRVIATETAVDVFDAQGNHVVAVRLNGAGIWADDSKSYDCKHGHCLAPLSEVVKEGRVLSQVEAAKEKKSVAAQASAQ